MTTLARPEPADVQAVAEQVWSSFLGGEDPLLPRVGDVDLGEGASWSAAVSISGGWEGTVTVELTAATAETLAGTMLGIEGPLDDDDVADAVGELANMIGGNIKGLMPGPSVLTLPVVASGRGGRPTTPRDASPRTIVEVSRLDALWRGDPVQVTVYAVAS
jgi:chemotaxis protein CheX